MGGWKLADVSPIPPTRQLADMILAPDGLDAFVHQARAEGMSWRRLTLALRDRTDGRIDVTYETMRSWYPHLVGVDPEDVPVASSPGDVA